MTRISFTLISSIPVSFGIHETIKLQATQAGLAIGPQGLSAYEVWLAEGNVGTEEDFLNSLRCQISEGAKSSSTDAGTLGDISVTDDYLYVCTQTGTAGNAIWKKIVMFAT